MDVTLPVDVGEESRVLLVPRHGSDYANVGLVAEVGEHMRLPGRIRAVSLSGLHRGIAGAATSDPQGRLWVEVDERHATTPLLWVLRDVLGMPGTKFRLLRRLHRADRRAQREVVPNAGEAGERPAGPDRGRCLRPRGRRRPGGVAPGERRPVRLLPAGPHPGGRRPARIDPSPSDASIARCSATSPKLL